MYFDIFGRSERQRASKEIGAILPILKARSTSDHAKVNNVSLDPRALVYQDLTDTVIMDWGEVVPRGKRLSFKDPRRQYALITSLTRPFSADEALDIVRERSEARAMEYERLLNLKLGAARKKSNAKQVERKKSDSSLLDTTIVADGTVERTKKAKG